jgi:tetratricopeptide (TPR) repeat protein
LAFQAQSIISIDSIGISIWGWILGGLIIGLSKINSIKIANENKTVKPLFKSENHLLQIQLISWINVVIGIVFCSFLYRGEISILEQRQIYNPKIETSRNETLRLGQQMKNLKMIDPYYRFMSSTYLITSGSEALGLKILDELIRQDPRNLDYLNARAGYFEQLTQYSNAIKTRLEIYKYDPWNARNLLSLGKNYKLMGDSENQLRVLQLILDFVGSNSIAEEARFELAVK